MVNTVIHFLSLPQNTKVVPTPVSTLVGSIGSMSDGTKNGWMQWEKEGHLQVWRVYPGWAHLICMVLSQMKTQRDLFKY